MQDENGRLRKVLAEKEYEIGYLKRKLDEESSLMNAMTASASNTSAGDAATASSKIVDLAKKVRELTSSLEAERTRNKQLAKTCADLEKKLEVRSQQQKQRHEAACKDDNEEESGSENEKKVSLAKENKELKDKLIQISHKMMEFKSQCEILKQDLKKTQKVIKHTFNYYFWSKKFFISFKIRHWKKKLEKMWTSKRFCPVKVIGEEDNSKLRIYKPKYVF